MMRDIRLYGHLAKRYGRLHRLDVNNPGEAVRALCAILPGFRQHILEHDRPGYHVVIDRGDIDADDLHLPSSGEIKLIPVVEGGKSKFGSILFGALLIGASFFLPTTPLFTIGKSIAPSLASIAFNAGLSLVLGGVAQMLSPTPSGPETPDRPENKPSFAFDGAVNAAAQGNAVPIGYGRLIVGSVVVSSGLYSESIAI